METTPPKSHCNKPNNPPLSFLFSLSHPTQKSFTSLSQHTHTHGLHNTEENKEEKEKEKGKMEEGKGLGLIGDRHTHLFSSSSPFVLPNQVRIPSTIRVFIDL